MNISFLDFWGGFQPENNLFYFILRDIRSDVKITHPAYADVIFFSCFGESNRCFNHCKKIFFTGENLRPDFSECDYSISFDFDDYNNKNIRIPLWYLYIDWYNVMSYGNPSWLVPINYLTQENEFNQKNKDNFCCIVYSKYNILRYEMTSNLSYYKFVDCFGKIHNKKILDGEKYKMNTISNYKFNICFENSLYSGYYTEKLLHAKVSGAIPIYYSDKEFRVDFNEKCCLNLINYENISDLLDDIKKIDNDSNLYNKIKSEPLFTNVPNLDNIKNNLNKVL